MTRLDISLKKRLIRHKCGPNPASDFVGFRRETNSYVGKPILTSDFVGFFFRFFLVIFVFFSHVLFFLVFLENFHDDLGFNDLIIY